MKKFKIFYSLSFIAYCSIAGSIYSQFGLQYALKIIIPFAIIYGTILGSLHVLMKKYFEEKTNKEETNNK